MLIEKRLPDLLHMLLPTELIDGYRLYRSGRLTEERRRMAQLANLGQAPLALVVGCCDSRAAPETIFSAAPGELFVVRNVANIVPPYAPDGEFHGTSAAIEFAVLGLHIPDIVVLGHSRCGGIRAYLRAENSPEIRGEFIGRWMDLVAGAREAAVARKHEPGEEGFERAVEEAAIRTSIDNLRTFPAIAEREREGNIALHGAHFDISSGILSVLDRETDSFVDAVPAADE